MKNRFNSNLISNLFALLTTKIFSKVGFLMTFLFVILVSGCKPYQKQVCSGQPIANSHWNSGSNSYKKSLNGPNSSSVAHLGMIGSCSFSCDTVNGYSPDAAGTSCIVPAQGAIVGHYIDAPVKGLRYVAMPSGLTGLTLDSGAFDCMQGDNVKFYLGTGTSIFMGQATCATKILLSSNTDQAGAAITNSAMWEISVLLTALNKQGLDPANAIDVSDFANLNLSPVDLSTGKVYMTGINAVLANITAQLPTRTLNVSKFTSCSTVANPACYGPAVTKAKALVSNAIEYYSGSNTPVCRAGEYLNVTKTACVASLTCAGAQTFDTTTGLCVDPTCTAPLVLDPAAHLCVTPQVACTLANAQSNGVITTNSNSTIQGTTDGVDFSQCLLDAASCNSGFQIAADNKSCVAVTASCAVSDAIANGVNFTNTSAQPVGSNVNVQGSVSGLDVSQCLLTTTACVTNYQTAIDGKSCTPVITTCALADAIANGVVVTNSNSSVQGSVVAGDPVACTLAANACDAGYQLAGDSKSCSAIISSCTTIDAIANGVVVTNSNSSVQGSVVAGSTAQCLLADLACNSGYALSLDKKSCSAIITTCTIGDATTNGVDVTNSNSSLQGSVVAGNTAQCTLADLACNAGYQLSLDKKLCVSSSVACTIADATANGVNFNYTVAQPVGSNVNVQGMVTGLDITQCLLATNACDVGFLRSADSKSCISEPFITQPVIAITNGSLNGQNILTNQASINFLTSNPTVAREILISPSADCSVGSYSVFATPVSYTVAANTTAPVSVRYRNGTELSLCQSFSVTNDMIAPVLTNTQTGLISNGNQITLLGSCEGTLPITFTESLNNNSAVNCNNGVYSKAYNVATTEGVKTITLSETDGAGNTSNVNVNYTVDKTAPQVTVAQTSYISTGANITINGSCETGLPVQFTQAGNSNNASTASCLASAYTYSYTPISGTNLLVTVSQVDYAGNTGSTTFTYTYGLQNAVETFVGRPSFASVDGDPSVAQFSGPAGIVYSPTDDVFYVAESLSTKIRRVDRATGNVSTLVDLKSYSNFNSKNLTRTEGDSIPVEVDSSGNLYITTFKNLSNDITTILKITNTGVISDLNISNANISSIDSFGNLYAIRSANTIIKITPSLAITTFFTGTYQIHGTVFLPNGDMLARTSDGLFKRITPSGIVTSLIIYSDTGGGAFAGTVTKMSSNGADIYISDNYDGIYKLSASTLASVSLYAGIKTYVNKNLIENSYVNSTGLMARFNGIRGISALPNGEVYVTEYGNNRFRKIDQFGITSDFTGLGRYPYSIDGTSTTASFSPVLGRIVIDNADNTYIIDQVFNKIKKITQNGEVSNFAGNGTVGTTDGGLLNASFEGMSYTPELVSDGVNLYLSEGTSRIRKIDPLTQTVSTLLTTGTRTVLRLAFDRVNNTLYYVNDLCKIVKVTLNSSGAITSQVRLNGASDFDNSCGLYYSSTGVVGNYYLVFPQGSKFVADNNRLYFSDSQYHVIFTVNITNATHQVIAGQPSATGAYLDANGTLAKFNMPTELAKIGDFLYVYDYGNKRIRKISTISPYTVSTFAGDGIKGLVDSQIGLNARFFYIGGMGVNGSGKLIIKDDTKLRKISP